MAKKNAREEPPKPQVTENEQMSDIVFILDKMELILEAVSQIGQDGKFNTVAADRQNRNSFLKIDRYADAFENFIKNFWSQLKDPTRFGILSVKEDRLDDPAVQQAIEDIAAGKKTKAVEEFLKQYEIVPRNKENQSINQKNQEEMAKKNETQQQAAAADSQPQTQSPQYRYNESMINWEQLKNFGISREYLQERGLLEQMLKGYKTNQVVPISMNFGSAVLRTDARLSFQQSMAGEVVLGIHGIRQKPDLDRPYFGHIFSDEDKRNLLETGNMGPVSYTHLLITMEYFNGTPMHISITEIAYASGMLIGGLLLGLFGNYQKRILLITASIFMMGISLPISGLLPQSGFFIFVVCCAIMGLSVPFYSGVQTALFQEKIKPEYLGRVFSLTGSIMSLAMPIGLILSGFFADRIGVNHWFLLSGILIICIAIVCPMITEIRKLDAK